MALSSETLHWIAPHRFKTSCERHDTRNLEDYFEFVTARPEAVASITCPECRSVADAWLRTYEEDLRRLSRPRGCDS